MKYNFIKARDSIDINRHFSTILALWKNDEMSSYEFPVVHIYLHESFSGHIQDGLSFPAGYAINDEDIKWVSIQVGTNEYGNRTALVKFRERNEIPDVITEDEADLILKQKGLKEAWFDVDGNITNDVLGISGIISDIEAQSEEWIIDEGILTPDPLEEFDGSYELDGVTYDITIKNLIDMNGEAGKGYFAAVYNDGSIRRVSFQGNDWYDLDTKETAHATKIGEIIQKQFSGDDPELSYEFATEKGFSRSLTDTTPFGAWYKTPFGDEKRYVIIQALPLGDRVNYKVRYISEDKEVVPLTEENTDAIMEFDLELGYKEVGAETTSEDMIAIGMIVEDVTDSYV